MVVKELQITEEAKYLSYAIFNPDVPDNNPAHLIIKRYHDIISKYNKEGKGYYFTKDYFAIYWMLLILLF
uniref:Uncharacterized protein n=1 Tax=Meloidogyne enterolobii TaxID=390850 RepID=A0A6V7WCL3_MELEN|nr:unnamed protein product [Meloidogyne enterolobii]